ncbi:MAG: hypothetical protein PWP57_1277, partial [Candidatus Atribacteria bacterium]|nr:hypothetical protein [Candidatus Atribacteria bacterium]
CVFRHPSFQALSEDIMFEIPIQEIKPQEYFQFIKKN